MMTSRSAQAATWVLRYLHDDPHFDDLMGDLAEFRFEGRSQSWYWRQTVVAVVFHFVRDIWSQRLLSFRGLVVACALMPVYNVARLFALKVLAGDWYVRPLFDFRRTPLLHLFETSFQEIPKSLAHVARSAGSAYFAAACAILVVAAFLFGAATSMLVGRLHPRHEKTMIALYALTMLVTVLPNVGSFAVAAYSSRTFGAILHVVIYCTNNIVLITGIVFGGLALSRAERPS